MPEAWLRGPVPGVPPELMPAAHSLVDAREELEAAAAGLETGALWARPGDAASVGFHLRHVVGSLDRLLTYARGEALSPAQRSALESEAEPGAPPASADELLADVRAAVETALETFRATPPGTLQEPRAVGRAGLPSTVAGLLFHAAEHARRHAGQVIATAKLVRASASARPESTPAAGQHGGSPDPDLRLRRGDLVFRRARPGDREALVRMRTRLWPDSDPGEVDALLARPSAELVLLLAEGKGGARGFAEVGTRASADGCRTSPVAYLEGIWVDPEARRSGVASGLVALAEAWAAGRGLAELASDAELDNRGSRAFHRAVGFRDVGRVVCFAKAVVAGGG